MIRWILRNETLPKSNLKSGSIPEDRKDNNPIASELFSLSSCASKALHCVYNTRQKDTGLELGKILKNYFSIFKKLLARCADNLQANNLYGQQKENRTDYLFPRILCLFFVVKFKRLAKIFRTVSIPKEISKA